jgi:hypothetical protein
MEALLVVGIFVAVILILGPGASWVARRRLFLSEEQVWSRVQAARDREGTS